MSKINGFFMVLFLVAVVMTAMSASAEEAVAPAAEAPKATEVKKTTVSDLSDLDVKIEMAKRSAELAELQVRIKKAEMAAKALETPIPLQQPVLRQNTPARQSMGPSIKAGKGGLPVIKSISGRSGALRAELMFSDGSTVRVRAGDRLPDGKRVSQVTQDCVVVGKRRLRFGKVEDITPEISQLGEE